ncbi:MAG: VOC family protein [Gemmobacter sp.]
MQVRTCLWFDGGGREATTFYVSLLPDSRIDGHHAPDPGASFQIIDFTLAGTPYRILDAGPGFPQTEAASILVTTPDQTDTDRLWAALTDGGQAGRCGWLKDRWGVSWQIVPAELPTLLGHPAAMQALMGMSRIDLAGVRAAIAG